MCGRYSFSTNQEKLKKQFGIIEIGDTLEISFNVAPTQNAYVIADDTPEALQQMRWGLVPFWAKDVKIGAKMINARSETAMEKPAFRNAIKKRHCLIIADSFYEWKKINGQKIPYRISLKNNDLLAFAGVWEQWNQGEKSIKSFTILTCEPNQDMVNIHNRMPVILPENEIQRNWLEDYTYEGISELLKTPPNGLLEMYPVSSRVNSVKNNGPELHEPRIEQRNLFS